MLNVLVVHGDKESSRAVSCAIARIFEVSRSPSVRDAAALIAAGHRYDAIIHVTDGSSEELRRAIRAHSSWQASRVVSIASSGNFLLDGLKRDGIYLKRATTLAVIVAVEELTAPPVLRAA